jgi:predicted O-methyltransferase YrrM
MRNHPAASRTRPSFSAVATTPRRIVRRASSLAELARHPLAVDRRRRQLEMENERLRSIHEGWVPPGHFYSPFPDLAEYERRVPALLDPGRVLPGIDLREREQVALVETIGRLIKDLPFPAHNDGSTRYWADNPAYAWSDGAVLHGMLRYLRPRRIVEVGSGYSSAMILDTVDGWLGRDTAVTFVEPHTELLHSLLRPGDTAHMTIHGMPVQELPLGVFDALDAGDVLFLDLTHVVKPGSDVNHVILDVLPRLRPGVWVHFHDIFFPFEYPPEWVREGRAWQETYLLRAYLAENPHWEIRWFQSYLWLRHRRLLERLVPWSIRNPGGNLWLQKVD